MPALSLARTELAQRYPTSGIIYDQDSNLYLKDPSYWNYWDRPTKPGYPADDQVQSYVTSPPNVWWEQRRLWRNKWKQLGTGDEGEAIFPYTGEPPPGWNGRCVKEPGLLKADWGRPKLWWEWLEGPQDPLDWTSGLKSAAASAAGDFMGQFWDDDKCTLPIKLSSPTSKYWAEDGQAGFDLEQPGAPWPRRGTFRRKKADQKAYTDWEQEKWLAEHTLRRSTQKGFPRAFTPRGLENATPRFEDRFAEDEPATLDPRLPRPASLPDLRKYPVSQQEAMWKDARMEAFDGNVDALGLKSMGADLMGIDMLDMKAYKRLMQAEPQWVEQFLKGKVSQEQHPVGYGIDEKTFEFVKEPKHPLVEPTPPPWYPSNVLKQFPTFEDVWKRRMKRAMDAAANMSRFSGSSAREAQDDLDHTWQQLSNPPDNSPRGLIKRAEAEAEAERGAEPPPVTAGQEAKVRMEAMSSANAADVERVADDPAERTAARETVLQKGADTTAPAAETMDSKGSQGGKDWNSSQVQAEKPAEDAYTSISGPSKVDPVADPLTMSTPVTLTCSTIFASPVRPERSTQARAIGSFL
ncbi:unnamed protein product [Durusdinium trenchii]|uniref:Uncharacterized protein n=1 Tax=Durusdinium trenchii TaxID=1381693 RepID=A0ABP0RVP0_9DINO